MRPQVDIYSIAQRCLSTIKMVVSDGPALTNFAGFDKRKSRMIDFFGGLSMKETAEVLGVSPSTLRHDWTLARAWLQREISA